MTVYVAFFRGQGGVATSFGLDQMAAQARADGCLADVFNYGQFAAGLAAIEAHLKAHDLLMVVGFSLGGGDVTLLSKDGVPIDTLVAVDPSQLGYNYQLNPKTTKRSVLWYDDNWILNGPIGHAGLNLGFQIVCQTWDWHLVVDKDPRIQATVRYEWLRLKHQLAASSGQITR